jgi:hypothetical protein
VALSAFISQQAFAVTIFDNRSDLKGGTEVVDGGSTNGWWGQAAVPEPATVGLLAAAGITGGLALIRRRR